MFVIAIATPASYINALLDGDAMAILCRILRIPSCGHLSVVSFIRSGVLS